MTTLRQINLDTIKSCIQTTVKGLVSRFKLDDRTALTAAGARRPPTRTAMPLRRVA